MRKFAERSLYLLVIAIVLAATGLRLDYAPAAAYDVAQGYAGSKLLISPTTVLVDQSGTAVSGGNPMPIVQMTSASAVSATNPLPVVTEYGSITSMTDHYVTQQYLAPNGEITAVPLYKLVGDVFTGPGLDPNFWNTSLGTGGSAVIAAGQLTISTGTTANNAVEMTSVRTARFSGLAPNKLRIVVQLPDTGVANNLRHWGVGLVTGATVNSGAMFQMNGTSFELITAKNSVISTISNGTFNGQYGATFNPGTSSHFYEIIYQPRQVIWLADNKIIHTLSAGNTPWTDNLHLQIHLGSVNSNGLATNVSFSSRIATIARFGISEMQPRSIFLVGLNAGTNLKNTPGNIHSVILSAITNNAVLTLYDNTSATGTVLWSSGALPSNGTPFMIDMHKILFSTGLSAAITGASLSALIIYE